jgi:hypothetical protein
MRTVNDLKIQTKSRRTDFEFVKGSKKARNFIEYKLIIQKTVSSKKQETYFGGFNKFLISFTNEI